MLEDDIDKPDWISRHCEGTPHLEQDVMYSAVAKIQKFIGLKLSVTL